MSKETKSKRFISIRLRLFLQVGAIVLIAVTLILALNKWYLSSIYILNQKRTMQYLAEEIDTYDVSAADYSSKIALLEKDNGVTIDVYMSDGTPLYYGAVPTGITGGKIVIKDRHDNPDGSFFEIQENAMSDTQFIVYGKSLKFGGDLEMYSKKTTIDSYADTAINVMLITSILALCATLVAIYFYSKKFTKPLIEMSSVTGGMADMDFSKKCEYGGNDEIGTLASSINELSDSLNSMLVDLNEKNRRLQEDIEKEQQLDKIRKDFISNVSHELKTPISIIQGYSEGAKLMLDSGDTKGASEYCEIITDETHKMNMLVLQLLELSMYESGNVKLSMDKIDIRAAAEEYGEENRLKFENKGIKFINDIPSDCFGLGDSVKIRMIFNNYISNACSHVSGDNIIRVYKGQSLDEGSIRICVYNSGSHIDSDDMDKIWISFYRADKSHSRAEGRFGLGLSIVGAIQKLHGEKYGAENTDDGVVFWFDIKKA